MADRRLSKHDLKKLTSHSGFRARLTKPTPRWTPGSRKAKKLATAWSKAVEDKIVSDQPPVKL